MRYERPFEKSSVGSFLKSPNDLSTINLKGKKTKISVKTFDDNLKNNDFSLFFSDKILIKGSHFDSTNLPKILNQSTNSNIISKVNKDIMIDIKDIKAPLSEKLRNFKLIGKIENGKFTKISSKGDFGNNNYLDISMKKDKNDKKNECLE